MLALIARRLLQTLTIVAVVCTATFALLHAAPGDPVDAMTADPRMTAAVRAHERARLGLDQPLAVQYVRYVAATARGDLGWSLTSNRPVAEAFAETVPRTLLLMGVALILSFAIGIALGVAQAMRRHSWFDRVAGLVSTICWSIPEFWLALMVLLLFSVELGVLPSGGMRDITTYEFASPLGRVWDVARHLLLPASTLAILSAAGIARFQRGAMMDVMREDYVRTARAKGLDERSVMLRHVLRNALLPIVTLVGLYFPALLGGSVFVERIFSWPGMGELTLRAIGSRDYPVVLASVMIGTVLVCAGSLLADLLMRWVNPRLRSA